MQQNDWLCNEHAQQINKICIDHHQCKDRRLCIDCIIDNHQQIKKQRMPSTQEFLNILNNKLKYFKEDDYRGFVKTIEALQGKVNLEFNNLKKLTKSVIETITLGDKQILELKDQLTKRPLLEFSRGDYDFMKDIIEGNILEHRLFWRKKCKTICEEQFQGLQDNLQLIIDEVQMMTQETICEQLDRNVQIKGQLLFGLKQGEFHYIYDGSTEYAGKYELGMKQGVWNDYLGFNRQKEKRIFDSVKYLNGINLGKDDWPQGLFDQQFNKIGEWQEIGGTWNQLIYKGQYNKGVKVGYWKEYYGEKIIGQGKYNNLGQKIGKWQESVENYDEFAQVILKGEYKSGIRIGQWQTMYEGKNIGGGTYDEQGVKIGEWADIHENFYDLCQVIFVGEYINGIKFGEWQTIYEGQVIGGGEYDENGLKCGQWTDLHENFKSYCKVVFIGEYNNGELIEQQNKFEIMQ